VYALVGNREDALDITQESFLKAFRSIRRFRQESRFHTWLFRIAYNQAVDFMRKEFRKKHVEYEDHYGQPLDGYLRTPPSTDFHPGRELSRKELSRVVMEAIQSLPEHHRAIILLREVEGLSYGDISRTLGIRKGTVMSRLHYAREKLRRILLPYIEEGKSGGKKSM